MQMILTNKTITTINTAITFSILFHKLCFQITILAGSPDNKYWIFFT